MGRSRRQSVPPEVSRASHLFDFDRSYLSVSSVNGVNRARDEVRERAVKEPRLLQSDATSLSRERGTERERERGREGEQNDEGRESTRGMEAAWTTENGVILPACG